jgi:hypothetical protein
VKVRLSDGLALPVPEARTERYRAAAGRDMIFGIRPAPFTAPRGARDARSRQTMVFFGVNGTEVCARVESSSVAGRASRCGSAPTSTTCT